MNAVSRRFGAGLLFASSVIAVAPACGGDSASATSRGDDEDADDDDEAAASRDAGKKAAGKDAGKAASKDAGKSSSEAEGACEVESCEAQIRLFEATLPAAAGAATACCVDDVKCGIEVSFPTFAGRCIDPATIAGMLPGARGDGGIADLGRTDAGRVDAGRVDAGRIDAGRTDGGTAGRGERVELDDGGVIYLDPSCPDFPTQFGVSTPGCCLPSKQCGLSSHTLTLPVPKACQGYDEIRAFGAMVDFPEKSCTQGP